MPHGIHLFFLQGLKELATEATALSNDITESRASARLGKKVDTMIEKINVDLREIEEKSVDEGEIPIDADKYGKLKKFMFFIQDTLKSLLKYFLADPMATEQIQEKLS